MRPAAPKLCHIFTYAERPKQSHRLSRLSAKFPFATTTGQGRSTSQHSAHRGRWDESIARIWGRPQDGAAWPSAHRWHSEHQRWGQKVHGEFLKYWPESIRFHAGTENRLVGWPKKVASGITLAKFSHGFQQVGRLVPSGHNSAHPIGQGRQLLLGPWSKVLSPCACVSSVQEGALCGFTWFVNASLPYQSPLFSIALEARWIGKTGGRMWGTELGGIARDGIGDVAEVFAHGRATLCGQWVKSEDEILAFSRWQALCKWASETSTLGNLRRNRQSKTIFPPYFQFISRIQWIRREEAKIHP